MIKVNAIGDKCPVPIIKTREAISSLGGAGRVEVAVDNEIAVQNLTKMANQKGYEISSEKTGDNEYTVILTVGDAPEETEEEAVCTPDMRGDTVVVISGGTMGDGDKELGETLLKGFIFALSKQEKLPSAMIFYNRGAFLTTEGSDSLEDLKSMEAMGVEILTCGTCLNHYGIAEKLCVGSVTNMYVIAEKMTGASKVVKPC